MHVHVHIAIIAKLLALTDILQTSHGPTALGIHAESQIPIMNQGQCAQLCRNGDCQPQL